MSYLKGVRSINGILKNLKHLDCSKTSMVPSGRQLQLNLENIRVHVKDAWRRIKPPNLKKGSWSQEEYQTLFDLVNFDLRLKAFERKQTKHGMLRDNIAWEAISEKMSTRRQNSCCIKWYDQLSSPMVGAGVWALIQMTIVLLRHPEKLAVSGGIK